MPRKCITDNIFITFETIHSIKRCLKGKCFKVSIKLDICKTYDRIEWNFIECVMRKLGFDVRWVNLVMNCAKLCPTLC